MEQQQILNAKKNPFCSLQPAEWLTSYWILNLMDRTSGYIINHILKVSEFWTTALIRLLFLE